MAITFLVDDVDKVTAEPMTRSLREHVGEVMAFGGDGARRVLAGAAAHVHPFIGAVHTAFAEHRALVLSPDVIWLTILAGFTQHVRLNSERLRERFVRFHDHKLLQVTLNVSLREQPDAIQAAVPKLRDLIATEVGDGIARLLTCEFSTTTAVERMASEIMLMDTFSPYFSYAIECVCGVPEITLMGEVEDWRQIRERIDVIAEFELEWWTASLAPILDEFVRASQGSPKTTFFHDIYQPRDAYGGETTVGWAARFYPYLFEFNSGRYDRKNPLLENPLGWRPKPNKRRFESDGIRPDRVPGALGSCRIIVNDHVLGTKYPLLLRGGLAAVGVNADGGLEPLACWSVIEDTGTLRSVIENLRARADVRFTPPEPRPAETSVLDHFCDDIELLQLTDVFGELRVFEGAAEWRFRARSEQVLIAVPHQPHYTAAAKRLIDLPDGSFLAFASGHGKAGWATASCVSTSATSNPPRKLRRTMK